MIFIHFCFCFVTFFVIFLFAERNVWYDAAIRNIETRIRAAAATTSTGTSPPVGEARNVVLFVGDGMGTSTLTASRILFGQRRGNTGEEAELTWDTFPAVALARVSILQYYIHLLL